MKRIQLEIEAVSPLAIARQKPGGSVSEAEDYIPGTVIRGAIAAQILQRTPHRNENLTQKGGDFQALFLGENPAIFQNAYPAVIEGGKRSQIQGEVMVLPATALSSKNDSGFKNKDKNGVFDTLIERFCAEGYGVVYDPNCPNDGGRLEPYGGFYSKLNDKYYSHSVEKRLLTRVGINRRRATAEEQILYSIEVINESPDKRSRKKPVIFCSSILVADELADSLTQFISDRSEQFRLGGSTSRGLGRVKIKAEVLDIKSQVKKRINDFNEKLRKRWNQWNIFDESLEELPSDRTYFTLDLQSDAILTEQWRRTTVISETMLREFARVDENLSLKLEAAYSSYSYRSGWNAAWGLMKDVELVTNKGGVYLYSTTEGNAWSEALEELELKGVGDRTCEGFGQVQICNEFHLIFRENAV